MAYDKRDEYTLDRSVHTGEGKSSIYCLNEVSRKDSHRFGKKIPNKYPRIFLLWGNLEKWY